MGSQPNKKLLKFIHKTRYTLSYNTLPETYTDIGSTAATVIKYLRRRSQIPIYMYLSRYGLSEGSHLSTRIALPHYCFRKALESLAGSVWEGTPSSFLPLPVWTFPHSPCPRPQPANGAQHTLAKQQAEAHVGQIWACLTALPLGLPKTL